MYELSMLILQFITSAIILISMYYRSKDKNHMGIASKLSVIAAVLVVIYATLTYQFFFAAVNLVALYFAIKSAILWRN
jgi:hypothetical protein